jgi:PAS domain S-box-containing protein
MSERSNIAQMMGEAAAAAKSPVMDRAGPSHAQATDHVVQFYEDDAVLTSAVARFLGEGLRAGDFVIAIATEPHKQAIEGQLAFEGLDVPRSCASGQLTFLDAHETLSKFMRVGEPDRALFEAAVGTPIAKLVAAAGSARLRAYGEMVDVLWNQGDRKSAIRLEELWNDLQNRHLFTLLCAYAMAGFYKEPAFLHSVCNAHTHVVGEGPDGADGAPSNLYPTGLPPRYARALAREIAQREEVERSLRVSLQELRRKEEQLRVSQRQLQSTTDALPVLVSYVDADKRYQFVSAAYERWFGRPKAEILGRRVEEVVGTAAYQGIRPHIERALSGERVTWEAEVPYSHGGARFVEATYIPQIDEDGRIAGCVAFVADLTERKNFERFRTAGAARAERLLKITGAIADAVTTTEVFEAVVDNVAGAVDASTAALWLVDQEGLTVRLVRAFGYSASDQQMFDTLPIDLDPSIPAVDTIRRGEPMWFPSQEALVREYPHLGAVVTAGRSYRVSCLPLISHGRTLGALAITIEEAREPSEEERSFLLLVARYAGQAIERLRLLEAERRSRAEADAAAARTGLLSHASRIFVDAKFDLAERVDEIARELATVLDSSVGLSLLEGDRRLHASSVYHPLPEAQQALRAVAAAAPMEVGEGITGSVVETGKSVIIPATDPGAVAARAAPAYRAFLEQYPIYAMLCAPLRARGRVIGAVTATRTRKGETYTHEDLELLEELAERAASAIENSRLHHENVEGRSRAEQLYRFAQCVMVAERVEEVFEAALDAIEGALGTNRAAILLYDADGVMRFRASRHLSDGYCRAVEGHSPWPRDAIAPKPILVSDVATDADMAPYLPLFRREGIGALAFIPLVTRGRLIGKFMVYFREAHACSTNEIELASAIANHLASVTARFSAVAKLEETIRYNELFAGVLAHDLRNPLGAMMTAAQLLLMRQEGAGDKNAKPLTRILASGQRITRMIDQLLDFTRARVGGGIEVQPRDVNLADLCDQVISELELAYPDWRIEREIAGDQDGSWDPDRILQILSNLLGNAGQHGDVASGILVKLDGRRTDAVTLEVRNRGVIPASLLPNLFDPFCGTRHRRDHSRGLGLGLFIIKEIVRAHGGAVDVTSSEAEGTAFTITLPRRAPRSAVAFSTTTNGAV